MVNDVDNVVGASLGTNTTADTFSRVYLCDAVNDVDSVLWANLCAVAVAKARIGAKTVARIVKVCGKARLVTLIVKAFLNDIASTAARNVSDFFDHVFGLNAQNCSDFRSGLISAGRTKVGACFFLAT